MRKQRGFVSGRRFRHIIFSKLIDALMHVLHKPNMTLPLAACRLPLAACRLPLAACRLPLAACRLPLAASL
jgi:hypothetical protein